MIAECRAAYQAYEFHKVYHTLNQFCAVDLSSLYVDITKDRMYCDAPNAPRRRATQAAMHRIFDGLCRLLAPITVFTAEEAWSYLGASKSVHLELFPEPDPAWRNAAVEEQVTQLLSLRGVIGQAVERARQEKLIGNALEAAVVLRCDQEIDFLDSKRTARGVFYSQRAQNRAREGAVRVNLENNPRQMRALLASSSHRRGERGTS